MPGATTASTVRLNRPPSVRRPHPPILIGGGGEKKTLRLVAQYADACNIFDMGPDRVRAKYDVIRAHCADVGRDDGDIEKTVLSRMALSHNGGTHESGQPFVSADEAVDRLGALAAVGTDQVILGMANDTDDAAYEVVAEVVRQVEGIVPAGR